MYALGMGIMKMDGYLMFLDYRTCPLGWMVEEFADV